MDSNINKFRSYFYQRPVRTKAANVFAEYTIFDNSAGTRELYEILYPNPNLLKILLLNSNIIMPIYFIVVIVFLLFFGPVN